MQRSTNTTTSRSSSVDMNYLLVASVVLTIPRLTLTIPFIVIGGYIYRGDEVKGTSIGGTFRCHFSWNLLKKVAVRIGRFAGEGFFIISTAFDFVVVITILVIVVIVIAMVVTS